MAASQRAPLRQQTRCRRLLLVVLGPVRPSLFNGSLFIGFSAKRCRMSPLQLGRKLKPTITLVLGVSWHGCLRRFMPTTLRMRFGVLVFLSLLVQKLLLG